MQVAVAMGPPLLNRQKKELLTKAWEMGDLRKKVSKEILRLSLKILWEKKELVRTFAIAPKASNVWEGCVRRLRILCTVATRQAVFLGQFAAPLVQVKESAVKRGVLVVVYVIVHLAWHVKVVSALPLGKKSHVVQGAQSVEKELHVSGQMEASASVEKSQRVNKPAIANKEKTAWKVDV